MPDGDRSLSDGVLNPLAYKHDRLVLTTSFTFLLAVLDDRGIITNPVISRLSVPRGS
jgi:hypothetical protein